MPAAGSLRYTAPAACIASHCAAEQPGKAIEKPPARGGFSMAPAAGLEPAA